MSARAIASATVSFGLVTIPVKVYPSGESAADVRFNMLHRKCSTRLKQQYVCPKDGEVVGRDDMARGYEFTKGQFVLFTDEEIKRLQEKATQAIEITEFVPAAKVDPIYFDSSYYLGPDKGGDRAYKLLATALKKSGRAALAKYAARGKQYLVMLRTLEGALVMQQLRYADEVRPVAEIPLGDAVVKEQELKLAMQILEQAVSEQFRPEQYEDDVRKRMLEAIDQKVQGKEISEVPEEPQAQIIDLMEALKASLQQEGGRKPARRAPRQDVGKAKAEAKAAAPKRARKARG
jgi:DNA end-binding protein Ku